MSLSEKKRYENESHGEKREQKRHSRAGKIHYSLATKCNKTVKKTKSFQYDEET